MTASVDSLGILSYQFYALLRFFALALTIPRIGLLKTGESSGQGSGAGHST
jgi:hypothetical protein